MESSMEDLHMVKTALRINYCTVLKLRHCNDSLPCSEQFEVIQRICSSLQLELLGKYSSYQGGQAYLSGLSVVIHARLAIFGRKYCIPVQSGSSSKCINKQTKYIKQQVHQVCRSLTLVRLAGTQTSN